jgi:DNA-binding transcriptional LysR family regulator
MLLDRIELFVNVARHQNLAKTARGMHVSPSSVSQRLKSLERDFNVKLYRRHKNGIELTHAGRTLLNTARQVLQEIDTLRRTLNPNAEKPVKTLMIAATHNPSALALPSAIAAFQRINPEVKVTFLTSYRSTVEKWLRQGEVDIAVIQSPSDECIADFCAEQFATDTLQFFTYAGHPLTKKNQNLRLQDLAQTPLIVRDGKGTTEKMLRVLRERGAKLNVSLRCATPDAVKAAVRKKTGVGILFHNFIAEDIRRGELKVFQVAGVPRITATSYIAFDKGKSLSGPANTFLTLLREMKSRRGKPIAMRDLTGTDQL